MRSVKLGDIAQVTFGELSSPAVVADVGPRRKVGEGSIALASALGLDTSPRQGGARAGVECLVFCGSTLGWPRVFDDITRQVDELYAAWRDHGSSARS